jgi:hypothetical protein
MLRSGKVVGFALSDVLFGHSRCLPLSMLHAILASESDWRLSHACYTLEDASRLSTCLSMTFSIARTTSDLVNKLVMT